MFGRPGEKKAKVSKLQTAHDSVSEASTSVSCFFALRIATPTKVILVLVHHEGAPNALVNGQLILGQCHRGIDRPTLAFQVPQVSSVPISVRFAPMGAPTVS